MALPVATVALSIPVTVAPVANSKLVLAFKVVPVTAAGVVPPRTASTVPALMSAVVAVKSDVVIAAGVVAPITVASIVPAFMSAVVATKLVVVTAAATAPPITVPSIVPPSMFTVLAVSTLNGNVIKVEPSYILATWLPAPADVSIQTRPSAIETAGAVAAV